MGNAIRNQRGVALLVVLWVVVLLLAMATDFSSSMRLEALGAINHKEEGVAYYLALAGKEHALALLAGRKADEEAQEGTWVDDGEGLFFNRFEGEAGGTISIIAAEDERRWRQEGYPFGSGRYGFRLGDEGAKIHLNIAPRQVLMALLRYSGVESPVDRDTIADSILDWIDKDHDHHLNGAEDEYYQSLDPPYQAKNGKFDDLDELLLVKGVTPEILYGGPGNRVGSAPSDLLLGNGRSVGIYPYLTLMGEGDEEKINLNTAPEIVLRAIGVPEDGVAEVMAHRVDQPYEDPPDFLLTLHLPVEVGIAPSSYFSLEAWGRVKGSPIVRRVRAIVKRGDSEDEFTTFYWNDNPF